MQKLRLKVVVWCPLSHIISSRGMTGPGSGSGSGSSAFPFPLPDSWQCLMLTSHQCCFRVRTFQLGWGPGDTHSNHSFLFDFISFWKGRQLSFILWREWGGKKPLNSILHYSLWIIPFPLNKISLNFILVGGFQKWKNNWPLQGVYLKWVRDDSSLAWKTPGFM